MLIFQQLAKWKKIQWEIVRIAGQDSCKIIMFLDWPICIDCQESLLLVCANAIILQFHQDFQAIIYPVFIDFANNI
jgi:hypothetical protein